MSVVTLVSGGLDSTVMAVLIKEAGVKQYPLFIDYGQRAAAREWKTCKHVHRRLELPDPVRMGLSGFGQLIPSGLTRTSMRLNEDAFLPGRNLLFILAAAAYGYAFDATAVLIGLLDEKGQIFPDQSSSFLKATGDLVTLVLQRSVSVLAPMMRFRKQEVVRLAELRGIEGTYSCHAGTDQPCGVCVSCLERQRAGAGNGRQL